MKRQIVIILLALALAGVCSSVYPQSFSVKWSYTLQPLTTRMNFGSSPAIKNLGPDVNTVGGEPAQNMEIVTGSDEYSNSYPELGAPAYGIWRCFDSQGNIEWAVDTKSDEARTSPVIVDINSDENLEIGTGTTSGWCVEIMNRFGSWTGGVSDAAWTFPYPPERSGSFMWHSSPAAANLVTGPHLEGLEIVIGNNPYGSIWVLDGDNSDQIDDGITADLSSWGYPGPLGTEGADWDVLWVFNTNGSIIATPAIGDVDGDGLLEVLVGSADSVMYCLRGQDGTAEWSYATTGPIYGSAGLADFEGDGDLEVVVGSTDGKVYCLDGDENGNGMIDPPEVTSFASGASVYSSPAIGDINGDNNYEIVIGSDDYNVYSLNYSPTANTVEEDWRYTTGGAVQSSPAIANSGRSTPTSYVGSTDGILYSFQGDGTLIAQYPTGGQIVTSPSVADIDGDGKLEIAVMVWNQPDVFTVLRDDDSNVLPYAAEWTMFRHDESRTGLYPWKPPVYDPDAAVTKILSPSGSYLQNIPITPQAVVSNFGHNTATIPVQFTIALGNTGLYSSARTVTLGPGLSTTVTFDDYPNITVGNLTATCASTLSGDGDPDDDFKTSAFVVYQPQWAEHFELTNGGFTAQGNWEWGVPTSGPGAAYDGANVWATILAGDYSNSAHWQLTSVDYKATQNNPVLLFYQWYAIEQGQDGGNVKVSLDGGATWNMATPVGGYPGIATWDNSGIPDEPCYTDSSHGWSLAVVVLPVSNGQTFRVRWDFGSDPAIVRSGWYIDDVMGVGFVSALHDVTARSILSPTGTIYIGSAIQPSVVVENWGGFDETVSVSCALAGTAYVDTKIVDIPAGGIDTVIFGAWAAELGYHTVTAFTVLAGDAVPSNDTASAECDVVALPAITIDNVSVAEGNAGTKSAGFNIHLSPASTQVVTVAFGTQDGSAMTGDNDYTPASNTVQFDPGDTIKTISVTILCDTKVEPDETFILALSAPVNATLEATQGVGTILNDDYTGVQEYATLGQGFFGNSGGRDCRNNLTPQELVTSLLASGDLVVGQTGHSMTLRQGQALADAVCLLRRLPAGGSSMQLPSGDAVFAPNCSPTSPVPLKNGKFQNVLLGQTIALALNLRLDPNIGALVLSDTYLCTQAASYVDRVCGNGNDAAIPGTEQWYYIPESVLEALGSNNTVYDLFALANLGLAQGGGATGVSGIAPLNSIAKALESVNEAFEKGRFLVGFSPYPAVAVQRSGEIADETLPLAYAVSNYPNPFNPSTTIRFELPEESYVTLKVYNFIGQELITLVNETREAGSHEVRFDASGYPSGVCFYRIQAGPFVQNRKLLLLK